MNLDTQLVAAQTEVETLTTQLTESKEQLQAQAIELAQLRERLAAAEEAGRAAAQAHAAELAQSRNMAERLRAELDTLREASANELKMAWQELANVKSAAENDVRHARDEALRYQQAVAQTNGQLVQLRNEMAQARELAAAAREEAAGLRGRVEAVDSQRTELLQALSGRTPIAQTQASVGTLNVGLVLRTKKPPALARPGEKRRVFLRFIQSEFNTSPLQNPPRSGSIPRPPRRGTGTWLQRAAKPLKIPIAGQTHTVAKRFQLSETGRQTRCCPKGSSPCASVVSHYRSNPTHRSPPLGCQAQPVPPESVGQRGSPFRLQLLRNVAPLSQQDG